MSGGSYNYLYDVCDLEDLQSKQSSLRDMADRLAGLGYAQDAAAETEELLTLFYQWQTRAGVRIRRLEHTWKAVEWWDSCDSSEDAVKKALAAYRNDHGDTPPP
jgi:3-methyladenine DNA glycosylase AlkD